jgi:hypothetical protein
MRDVRVRAVLERLPVPPERAEFFEELWEKAEANERCAARRWRRTSLVFAVLVVAATTTAGVLAFGRATGATVIDRTIQCQTPNISHALYVGASVRRALPRTVPGATFPANAGGVGVEDISGIVLAGAGSLGKGGYTLDLNPPCRSARPLSFSQAGLPGPTTWQGTGGESSAWHCTLGAFATIRLRVTLDKARQPVAAALELATGAKARPAAYIDWTPTLVRAWVAPSCLMNGR